MISHRIRANGLEHHLVEWEGAGAGAAAEIVLLLHGFMDVASSWDRVAPQLVEAGFRVLAPDLRGFGDTDRVPEGGYYHFADYVADVAGLVDAVCGASPIFLIGHSMGGSIATLYAGAHPERIARLALLEGLGPPDNPASLAPLRMRRWLDDLRQHRSRGPSRGFDTLDEAFARLRMNHPRVQEEVLRTRLPHLIKTMPDGRFNWRFDELHRTTSPYPFRVDVQRTFAARISCPVLIIGGGPEGFHSEDDARRIDAFPKVTRAELDGAGHMMHWTQPEKLAKILVDFLLL